MFYFIANLKEYTYFTGAGVKRFDSYLMSVDFSDSFRDLIKKVTKNGQILVADNGNFDRITMLIKQFKKETKTLNQKRADIEKIIKGCLLPGQLGEELRTQYQNVAKRIVDEQKRLTTDEYVQQTVHKQFELKPRYIIGMEDLSLPVMTALNIEPEYTEFDSSFYAQRAETAIEYALRTKKGDFGECHTDVFAGMHAQSLDTAYIAGKMAAEARVDGVASGLGGALSDRSYIDYRVQNGQVIRLKNGVPRSYLRVAEIASGFQLGYASITGKRLPFHSLGVGTPILLVLIAALGDKPTFLASDSTAPIYDAWLSPTISFYVDTPAPLKLKSYKIAESWISQDMGWDCSCPYCRKFNKKYPSDINMARKWWKDQGQPKLEEYHMHSKHDLSRSLPLLGYHNDQTVANDAALARVGHNHWVLARIEKTARNAINNGDGLLNWAESKVEGYYHSPAGTAWKNAICESWEVIRNTVLDINSTSSQK